MSRGVGVNRVHLQFGTLKTDGDGEGGVTIDSADRAYPVNAVILTPNENVNPAAHELTPGTYHVTISAPQVVTVNYLTVSSD